MFTLKDISDFQAIAKDYGIQINDSQLLLFQKYHDFLLEWNEKINLISRQNANTETILERHFLDSIIFLPEISDLTRSTINDPRFTVLDIGSGAGFPAVPLAIMKPEWSFTLCESITKKANFLSELIRFLELANVSVRNNRVEDVRALHATTQHATPQQYDLITARAVAKLDELIKYSLPLLKKGGSLLAFKGPSYEEELKNAKGFIDSKKLKVEVLSKEVNGFSKKLVILKS